MRLALQASKKCLARPSRRIRIEQTEEGVKFCLKVMNDLTSRGIGDILVSVLDSLKTYAIDVSADLRSNEVPAKRIPRQDRYG